MRTKRKQLPLGPRALHLVRLAARGVVSSRELESGVLGSTSAEAARVCAISEARCNDQFHYLATRGLVRRTQLVRQHGKNGPMPKVWVATPAGVEVVGLGTRAEEGR